MDRNPILFFFFIAIVNGMAPVLIAGKNYKTIEDLPGGTIGASSLTSATVTALKEALKQKGLEYPRDDRLLIVAGGSASNLTALQSGQITATTVAVPLNHAAEELGLIPSGGSSMRCQIFRRPPSQYDARGRGKTIP